MVAPYVVVAAAAYGIYYLTRGSVEAAQGRGNVQRVTYEMVLPANPHEAGMRSSEEFVSLMSLASKVVITNNNGVPPDLSKFNQDSYGYWAKFDTINTKISKQKPLKQWKEIVVDPNTGRRVPKPDPSASSDTWNNYYSYQLRDTDGDGRYDDEWYFDNLKLVRESPPGTSAVLTLKLAWLQGPGTPPSDAKGNLVSYDVSQYLTNLNINPEDLQEGYIAPKYGPFSEAPRTNTNPPYFHFYTADGRLLLSLDILEHDYDPMDPNAPHPGGDPRFIPENVFYPNTGKEPMMIQTIKKNHFRMPIKRVFNKMIIVPDNQ